MIKSRAADGKASVTFTLDPAVRAGRVTICGDWNQWSCDADPMQRGEDGSFHVTIDLVPGRAYRFRYLLDGERWENDWAADAYVPNDFGGEDSLVDLTALAVEVPSATAAPAKKKVAATARKAAAPSAVTVKKEGRKSVKKADDRPR